MAKTKLEELVIELTVENKALVSEMKASQQQTGKAMKSMAKSVEKFSGDANKDISSFQRVFETAMGFVGGQFVIGALNKATEAAKALFSTLVTDGVSASIEQQQAISRLNIALAQSGEYSKQASEEFDQWATTLERSTNVSAQQVLNLASLAKGYGFNNDQAKKATAAAIDFAAAADISVVEALRRIGRTASGSISDVSKFVPELNNLTKAELKHGKAADLILAKYGGAGSIVLGDFSDQVTALGHSWGGVTELVGDAIVTNQAVLNAMSSLNGIIADGSSKVSEQNMTYKQLVGEGLVMVLEAAAALATAFDAAGRAGGAFADVVEKTFADVGQAITGVLGIFSDDFDEAFKAFEMQSNAAADSFENRFSGDTLLGDLSVKLLEVRDAANEGLGAIKEGAESIPEPVNVAKESIEELTQAQKDQAAAGRELAEQTILGMEEQNEIKNELMAEQFAAEVESLSQALEQKLITQGEFELALTEMKKKFSEKRIKDEEKQKKQELDLEMKTHKAKVDIASATANLLSAVAGRQSKAAFLAQKAAAIGQSIVATNLAAAQALANPPGPPATIPLAAMAKAAGNINTAAIIATTVQGFNKGGTVPGIGFQDSIPAMLTPKEEVVDRSTSQKLRSFLDSVSGFDGGSMAIHHTFGFRDGLDNFIELVESKLIERENLQISMRAS